MPSHCQCGYKMSRNLADHTARFLDQKHEEERTEIARRIAPQLSAEKEADRLAAEIVLRRLADDVCERVRSAISHTLCHSPLLPRDIALKLALDVESVSLPVLEYSTVLNDKDLLPIVRALPNIGRAAVARRHRVGTELSLALIEQGNDSVMKDIISNPSAELDSQSIDLAVKRVRTNDEAIALLNRPEIEPASILKLLDRTLRHFRNNLREDSAVKAHAQAVFDKAQQHAIIALGHSLNGAFLVRYAEALRNVGYLTDDLIFEALNSGSKRLVTATLASRAGVEPRDALNLIKDTSGIGFATLYIQASLPDLLFVEAEKKMRKLPF